MWGRISLRGRLFLLLILPLVAVAAIASFARYAGAARLTQELYDNTLLAVALTISRDVVLSEGTVLTEKLLDDLTTALGDPVYYRVTGPEGRFVTGYSNPPNPPAGVTAPDTGPWFFDSISTGRPVRVVVLRDFISDPQFGGWVTVEVWQTMFQRHALSRDLVMQSSVGLGVLILTAALILWFGIQLGLKPLWDLREAIDQRGADDLRPIRRWVPPELRPLVATTNSLFARLSQAFALRDGFISDAAHQLRNPIAAIQSQAEAAALAPDAQELRARVTDLATIARSTGRLTSQLLSLERVRGRSLKAFVQKVDLAGLLRARLRDFAETHLRQGVDVAFHVTGSPRMIECDPILIEELVANLLDNAAKYGLRAGGHLEVTIAFSPQSVSLIFADDGPGVPAPVRQRVFDRFFRMDDDHGGGCGLGLAIVADVAAAHGGNARCAPSATGARFEIDLPR